MSKLKLIFICSILCIQNIKSEVFQDRPKIKSSDGDLVLQPALDKNIYLLPNGPKSTIYVGEFNLIQRYSNSSTDLDQRLGNGDSENYIHGPNGILKRLEKLENQTSVTPNSYLANVTTIWRKVNNLNRKVLNLQNQLTNIRIDGCQSQPCQHGGTCLNLVRGYHCLCPPNWEGRDCDIDVNECRNFAGTDLGCQNGATCINKPGTYECLCRSNWFGLHCTRKAKDCSGGDLEMCGHGTCIPTSSGEGITCICHQGWTTNGTGVACLTDINECEFTQRYPCSVNPRVDCINLPGSFRCGLCPTGYEGDGYSCFDVDECLTIPNGGCSPMVACHNTVGSRICGSCPPGYQGDGITCTWRGSCNINHGGCHPSAQCVDILLGGQTQCTCPEGMDGDGLGLHGCYISTAGSNYTSQHCLSNPCGAHGQCHQLRTGYTCICLDGYSGAHCNNTKDYCAGNPCHNGGICNPDGTFRKGFRCECPAQYSGPLCQISSTTCGGVLNAEEGSIRYPLSNTTYHHNSRCAWVIHTVPDKVINVTFSKFNLEDNPDCLYDFLQIHDGRSSASQFIGRFCGNNFPKGGNIISSHNNLYFWFRSDGTVAKEGFALHWTSIAPICGGSINAETHGHISSPGSPGNYPPNRDCYWHLTTTLGKRIQMHFFELDIEAHANCSFDYLAIYDGQHIQDPLISKFCNSTHPAPVQSAGSDVLIHFHSDAFGSGHGFQIAYAPIEGAPGCGGYFTLDKGELNLPSFNGHYLSNLVCEYKIKTSPDTKIRIKFKSFKLESSLRCEYDSLKIYDGSSADSRLVGTFCGKTYPKTYTSSSNTLFMRFKSDYSKTFEGFQISYEAICQIDIIGDSGILKSPGYPFNYPENRVCEYILSSTPGKAIQLTFQDFDIEDNNYFNCRYDNVEIRDGPNINATLLGRYCGGSDHTPPVQTSTHNYMYIRFSSDMSISGRGFYANYTTINTECGGIYRKSTGLINHPSEDENSYKNDQTCNWLLIAPIGQYIKITWNTFDIEGIDECENDYVELIEIDYDNKNTTLGKFCSNKMPPAITVASNRLNIKFVSDSSITSNGFSVSYTFLDERTHCGATYIKTNGYIYSPGWPNPYTPSRDCVWIIIVPYGQQIRLNISQFDLEPSIGTLCIHGDYLEVRNGESASSPEIGKFCGTFESKRITSMANSIYLHFHSDSYIQGKGFKIEWDGTLTGCGGTLTSATGSISSPNYPNYYNDNAECFYRIVTNLGSVIQILFTEIELERTHRCYDDYIEIYDGRDNNAPSLGKFCSMPTNNKLKTSSNYAFIKFRSDFFISGKGFSLNYNSICHNNISGRAGVIESPGYPNSFSPITDCLWQINVPKGNKINVTFSHFDLPSNPRHFIFSRMPAWATLRRCVKYLQYKELSDSSFGQELCGSSLSPSIKTKSNSLQIKFVSSSLFRRGTGFRLEWVSYGCGGHIIKKYGTFSFNETPSLSGELECEWLLETPFGTIVELSILNIYMKSSNECNTDALEVYNGRDTNSPIISKICQKGYTSLKSTENFMLVKLIKRSTLKDVSFEASFSSSGSICGGYMHSITGYIYSKNYPKNYDNNLNCIWQIMVPMNHRIELNFVDIDMYPSGDDGCGDFIKIYDNSYVSNNYTQLVCPSSTSKKFISQNNMITIQFISDSLSTAKGFKLNFNTICGAVINATYDGIISNDRFMSHNNQSCIWTIIAPALDQKISLTIAHISLPRNNDIVTNKSCSSFLKVYDGNDINAPLIDEFCGKRAPPMIVTHGSAITVELGTYADIITGQFLAQYSPLSTTCGGELTSEEGAIASPNYPHAYPGNYDCEWILNTSPGNKVYVTFESFDVEYSEACNEDYLEIRENNGGGRLIGVYCGNNIPTNYTIASKLFIKFHSNEKTNGQGFLINYGFIHGNVITGSERGELASPLYPFSYHGSGDYTWRILTNPSVTITLTLDSLEIHSYSDICSNKLVIYDGYDETAPVIEELCGLLTAISKTITTSSNVVYIVLKMDESNTGSKFHLSWSETNLVTSNNDIDEGINCGFNNTRLLSEGESIIISSPNYPEHYDNGHFCQWIFEATPGRHLIIHFREFQLEETSNCFADSLSIYSATTPNQWQLIKDNVCLFSSLSADTNTSSYIKMNFKTDHSVTNKGFAAEVSSVCGGTISGISGEVGPIWNDWYKARKLAMRCDWKIKVRPGRSIKLEFSHFNITNNGDACLTKVTLRNGESIEAPLLSSGIYCGFSHENKADLVTSGNSLFVSYIISPSQNYALSNYQTFKIHYEEVNIECGSESILDVDHSWEVINTPNFPGVPLPFSECIWKFRGPPGEILRIDFMERFDLDDVDDCATEVVEIHDGWTELTTLKGRLCSEKPGTIKTSGNELFIKYLTTLTEPRNGFQANISIDICGGTIVADKGELKSPGYPHLQYFPYNTVCEWHIIGTRGMVLRLTLQDIDLPASDIPCSTNVTVSQFIISNNTKTAVKTFCSNNPHSSLSLEMFTNEAYVTLYLNKPKKWAQQSQGKGFHFHFNSSIPSCGEKVNTPKGVLSSPSYPLETTISYCYWMIELPNAKKRVRLELLDVNTNRQIINIFNGFTGQSLIERLTGDNTPTNTQVFESSGNKLTITIMLKQTASHHRFKAKFSSEGESLCGGDLSGLNGVLTSPEFNQSYSCEWMLNNKAPVQNNDVQYNTVYLTIKVNSSLSRRRCAFTDSKLSIKSNLIRTAPIIPDLCTQTEVSYRFPTTVLNIRATKSKDQSFSFSLQWNLQPCGGIVNVDSHPENILKIPDSYNSSLDCSWIIEVPYNNRINLEMKGAFELDCSDEFIRVKNGLYTEVNSQNNDYCITNMLEKNITSGFRYIIVEYHSQKNNNSTIKLLASTAKNLCGGTLNQYQNYFASPNFPKPYDANQECVWEITTDKGSRIALQFVERFVVEVKPNCTKDAVIIYDWKDNKYTQIARLCGRDLPPIYNSTNNKMKIVLRTDAETNLDGFAAMWQNICGGKYKATKEEQLLLSPGYPFTYKPELSCSYEIDSPNSERIIFKVLDFELQGSYPSCENDNVTFRAESYYDSMYETYCGNNYPNMISNYQKISIDFKTDMFYNKRGFKFSYKIYSCGGEVKTPSILASNDLPKYEHSMNCTWLIEAPENKIVVLEFLYIDVEGNSECYNDYIAVYNGPNIDEDSRLALLCGHVNKTVVLKSTSNKMALQMSTDASISYRGFKVDINFSYSKSVGCGGDIELTSGASKNIISPRFNGSAVYDNFLECHWNIKSPIDTVIKIEFVSFHVSSCFQVNQTALGYSKCDCDFVEIKDGFNPNDIVIGTYCGHTLPPNLITSKNSMSLRLSTDGELVSSGFEARLSVQQSICGKSVYTITKDTQRLKSPGYDAGSIPRGLHCSYHFENPSYKLLHISIINLDLSTSVQETGTTGCNRDKLMFTGNSLHPNVSLGKEYIVNYETDLLSDLGYNTIDANFPNKFEFCGVKKSIDLYLFGSVSLNLVTTPDIDSGVHKGVEIEIKLAGTCGRNYSEPQGRLYTSYHYYNDEEDTDEDCYTLITAPENYTISMYFISMSEGGGSSEHGYMDIFDGNTTSSNKIIRINTDEVNSNPIFSTGRYILMHDYSLYGAGIVFDMNYVITDKDRGCGGKLTNERGRITSPLYPEIYRKSSACEWELETPVGTRLKLHFDIFDLGRSCHQNYLQLINSQGDVVSSFCSEVPADYTSMDNYVKIVFITSMNNGGTGWIIDFAGVI